MADDDIYKNKQRIPGTRKSSKPLQRRHNRPHRKFDEKRKRRSKNSGLRRLLHLSRKEGNEKIIWYSFLIFIAILLLLVGVWQFWLLEIMARNDINKDLSEEGVEQTRVEESAQE